MNTLGKRRRAERPVRAEGNGHRSTTRRPVGGAAAVLVAAVLLGGAITVAAHRTAGPQTLQEKVEAVGSDLGCVTCQNLSVADSPAGTARAMRAEIKRRLLHGETPDQIKAFFVAKYGQSILLAPKSVVPWVVPAVGLVVGVGLLVWAIGRKRPPSDVGEVRLTPADRARIRRDLAALEEPE